MRSQTYREARECFKLTERRGPDRRLIALDSKQTYPRYVTLSSLELVMVFVHDQTRPIVLKAKELVSEEFSSETSMDATPSPRCKVDECIER